MTENLQIAALTTCDVADGGRTVRLRMRDTGGQEHTLDLPSEIASSLVLTLPRLMARCLQALRGDCARLVFPVHTWRLEAAGDAGAFILTLKTRDGFGIAFALEADDATALAEAMRLHCAPARRHTANKTLN